MNRKISRRDFVKGTAAAASLAVLPGTFPYIKNNSTIRKAIVIGMDGMDPILVQHMISRGELPTFKKLAERGSFSKLKTTLPPQSPVAWASFITGADPGVHGIFDFVHRIPETLTPYLSTSRTMEASKTIQLGSWTVPLSSAGVKLMRKGVALWDALANAGIPSTVFQIPSNYPTYSDNRLVHSISGMGTPDLLGTYGTFTMYTDKTFPPQSHKKEGRWVKVTFDDHKLNLNLLGPVNSFKSDEKPVSVDIKVERDPIEKVLRIHLQGEKVILQEGEWSKWVPVTFPMVPFLSSTKGMVRFYAKEIHPGFSLYCSPINVDPLDPVLPIATPLSYSEEVASQTGRFYTQGFPADTKALSAGAFNSHDFYQQSRVVFDESILNFEKTLSDFREGLYFFYFSSLDQSSHMLWRMMDPTHPLYEPDAEPQVKKAITNYYKEMDWVLSKALEKEDPQTLVIALSDHGFANFTREFNVSTWLAKNGFTQLVDEEKLGEGEFFDNVDWLESKAYVCGINGIFINRKDRDKYGWVSDTEAEEIKKEIILKLHGVIDPKTGKRVIVEAYDTNKEYTSPDQSIVPDIIIGYADGYRISDEAVLGKFPKDIVTDRIDPWSADHCVDPSVVPGLIISNKALQAKSPGLWDLAPSILTAFGVAVPSQMTGKNIFIW